MYFDEFAKYLSYFFDILVAELNLVGAKEIEKLKKKYFDISKK